MESIKAIFFAAFWTQFAQTPMIPNKLALQRMQPAFFHVTHLFEMIFQELF